MYNGKKLICMLINQLKKRKCMDLYSAQRGSTYLGTLIIICSTGVPIALDWKERWRRVHITWVFPTFLNKQAVRCEWLYSTLRMSFRPSGHGMK